VRARARTDGGAQPDPRILALRRRSAERLAPLLAHIGAVDSKRDAYLRRLVGTLFRLVPVKMVTRSECSIIGIGLSNGGLSHGSISPVPVSAALGEVCHIAKVLSL
jgi:hypothetical protein